MDIERLIEPAKPWAEGSWMTRVDQSASFLFLHGYITQAQREKITQKLEKQLKQGIAQGRIVLRNQKERDDGN